MGRDRVFDTRAVDRRPWQHPLGVDPVLGDKDLVRIPVGDFRRIDRDVRVPFDGGADDAPGLAGADDEVVVGIGVAAAEAV